MNIDAPSAAKFIAFSFYMRFDKKRIAAVPHAEQVRRSLDFLKRIGTLHPLLSNWFLQGQSLKSALKFNVLEDPSSLREEVERNLDPRDPIFLSFSVWNGEPDILKGGLSLNYRAHNLRSLSYMQFEDIGALALTIPEEVGSVVLNIMRTAVELWPEIDWATAAPQDHYLQEKIFKERQTIGWIGFCPRDLPRELFPDAYGVHHVEQRGTIIINTQEVFDLGNPTHTERVNNADRKLAEMDLLPLYNN